MLQAASLDEDQISRHLFATYPRHALTEVQNLPRYVFNNAEGSELKKVRRSPEEATFERMTKSLAKNRDGILFQRLTKRSKPDEEIFERLTKRGNTDEDEGGFMRITKKNDHDDDEAGFMRITKKNVAGDDEAGFMRITKKNDHDKVSHYILYSYLPFQKMKYAGLRPLNNVGLL